MAAPFRALGMVINIESKEIDDIEEQLKQFNELLVEQESELASIRSLNSLKTVQAMQSEIDANTELAASRKIALESGTLGGVDELYNELMEQIEVDEYEIKWEEEKQRRLTLIQQRHEEQRAEQEAKVLEERIKANQIFTMQFIQFSMMQMNSLNDVANAVRAAMLTEVKSRLAAGLSAVVQKAVSSVPFPFNIGAAVAAASLFSLTFDKIADQIPAFETGGMVGGRRHSHGGTLIEAEQGEFVVNRTSAGAAPNLLATINRSPSMANEIEQLVSGQSSRMGGAMGGGVTKVVLSLYDLDQAQRQYNQIQIAGGVA
jgi:hypothetical protein